MEKVKSVKSYDDLRLFFDEKQIISSEKLQDFANVTNNIFQVLAVGAMVNKKFCKKIQFYCAFEDVFSDSFLGTLQRYTSIIKDAEPKCTERTFRTYLYLLAETAILEEKLELIRELGKLMKFEHPHLRVAFFTKNKALIETVVKHYNNAYDLWELN